MVAIACAWPARSTASRRDDDRRPTRGALAPLRTDIRDDPFSLL
jgi:hypothetical protein